jgi:hypothetical protein
MTKPQFYRLKQISDTEVNGARRRLEQTIAPCVIIGLAALATGYCVWVRLSKAETPRSWVGFLATATGSLFVVTLPIIVAIYLPLVQAIQGLPA